MKAKALKSLLFFTLLFCITCKKPNADNGGDNNNYIPGSTSCYPTKLNIYDSTSGTITYFNLYYDSSKRVTVIATNNTGSPDSILFSYNAKNQVIRAIHQFGTYDSFVYNPSGTLATWYLNLSLPRINESYYTNFYYGNSGKVYSYSSYYQYYGPGSNGLFDSVAIGYDSKGNISSLQEYDMLHSFNGDETMTYDNNISAIRNMTFVTLLYYSTNYTNNSTFSLSSNVNNITSLNLGQGQEFLYNYKYNSNGLPISSLETGQGVILSGTNSLYTYSYNCH